MGSRGAILRFTCLCGAAVALAGCGATSHRAASGASGRSAQGGGPTAAHKVGKPDRLPAAASSGAGGFLAPGAPSDAQIRAEVAQARKEGIILPKANTAQAFEQGATYVGGGGGRSEE